MFGYIPIMENTRRSGIRGSSFAQQSIYIYIYNFRVSRFSFEAYIYICFEGKPRYPKVPTFMLLGMMSKQEVKKNKDRQRSRCADLERQRPLVLQQIERSIIYGQNSTSSCWKKRELTQTVIANSVERTNYNCYMLHQFKFGYFNLKSFLINLIRNIFCC